MRLLQFFFRGKTDLPVLSLKHVTDFDLKSNLMYDKYAYSKVFRVGDTVWWMGHDGVGGFFAGDSTVVDEELYNKKGNLHFYKRVAIIDI